MIYKFILFTMIALSAETKSILNFKGKIEVLGTPHQAKIILQTPDGQELPLCPSQNFEALRRLSKFTVSLAGILDPLQENCLSPEHVHILSFPYGAPAIVGSFTKATIYDAVFTDKQGQEYKFKRIPPSLKDDSSPIILTIVPGNPLQPHEGTWRIVTYSEYPLP